MAELLRSNIEREKILKELKIKPNENGVEINRLITLVRNDYRQLLLHHTAFSCANGKDVNGMLWKLCFYKQIEEYRRSIKKTVGMLEVAVDDNNPLTEKARRHLVKLTGAFLKFLSDSTAFYQDLLLQLEALHKDFAATGDSNPNLCDIVHCVHRCLLFLGDLARYKELHSDSHTSNFSEAEAYYERAAFLVPQAGGPHNQLAVLATYSDTECVAVYHYCRSILSDQPFAGGMDNLTLLFDKNAKTYSQLLGHSEQEMQRSMGLAAAQITSSAERSKKQIALKTKIFLINFVRLHGIIFSWTVKKHKEFQVASSSASEGEDLRCHLADEDMAAMNSEGFMTFLQEVLDIFDQLLIASTLGDLLLVRLIGICIFSVHNSSLRDLVQDMDGLDTAVAEQHSVAESLALMTMFGMINKIAARICLFSQPQEKSRKGVINRLLPAVSVFAEWASCHSQYLQAPTPLPPAVLSGSYFASSSSSSTTRLQSKVLRSALADKSVGLTETRTRSGMRSACSMMKDLVEDSIASPASAALSGHHGSSGRLSSSSTGFGGGGGGGGGRYKTGAVTSSSSAPVVSDAVLANQPLREHVELRGFSPLSSHIESFFLGMPPLATCAPHTVPEDLSRDRRLRVLRAFIRDWLIPSAVREANEAENRRVQQLESSSSAKPAQATIRGSKLKSNRNCDDRDDDNIISENAEQHQRTDRGRSSGAALSSTGKLVKTAMSKPRKGSRAVAPPSSSSASPGAHMDSQQSKRGVDCRRESERDQAQEEGRQFTVANLQHQRQQDVLQEQQRNQINNNAGSSVVGASMVSWMNNSHHHQVSSPLIGKSRPELDNDLVAFHGDATVMDSIDWTAGCADQAHFLGLRNESSHNITAFDEDYDNEGNDDDEDEALDYAHIGSLVSELQAHDSLGASGHFDYGGNAENAVPMLDEHDMMDKIIDEEEGEDDEVDDEVVFRPAFARCDAQSSENYLVSFPILSHSNSWAGLSTVSSASSPMFASSALAPARAETMAVTEEYEPWQQHSWGAEANHGVLPHTSAWGHCTDNSNSTIDNSPGSDSQGQGQDSARRDDFLAYLSHSSAQGQTAVAAPKSSLPSSSAALSRPPPPGLSSPPGLSLRQQSSLTVNPFFVDHSQGDAT